jgi:hypothetical protein
VFRLNSSTKALIPAILVLTFAMSAGTGVAVAAGTWKVKGAAVTKELLPTVAVKEVEGKSFTFLSKVFGEPFNIKCTGAEMVGIQLSTSGHLTAGGKIKFTGCQTEYRGEVWVLCAPTSGGEKGVFATEKLIGEIVLHEKAGLIHFEPEVGERIALLEAETPEVCPFPLSGTPMLGKLNLQDKELGTELVSHLVTQGPLTELWWVNDTLEHQVVTDGSMVLKLAGKHEGMSWSGIPE